MISMRWRLAAFLGVAYFLGFLPTFVLALFGTMAFLSGKSSASVDCVTLGMRRLNVSELEDDIGDVDHFDAGNREVGLDMPIGEPARRKRVKRVGCCCYLTLLLTIAFVVIVWRFGMFLERWFCANFVVLICVGFARLRNVCLFQLNSFMRGVIPLRSLSVLTSRRAASSVLGSELRHRNRLFPLRSSLKIHVLLSGRTLSKNVTMGL